VWIGVFAVATVAALFGFGIVSGARVLAGEVFGAFALSAAVALFLRARRPPDSLVSNFPVEVRIVPRYALETIIVVLLLLWLLGAFLVPVGGDLIHLLLLVVLVVVVVRLLQGRRTWS
jgi:hypothetical protein